MTQLVGQAEQGTHVRVNAHRVSLAISGQSANATRSTTVPAAESTATLSRPTGHRLRVCVTVQAVAASPGTVIATGPDTPLRSAPANTPSIAAGSAAAGAGVVEAAPWWCAPEAGADVVALRVVETSGGPALNASTACWKWPAGVNGEPELERETGPW